MSDIELVQSSPRTFVGIRREVSVQELPAFFSEVLPKVMGWMAARGHTPASMPMCMWCGMDMETGIADAHAGCFTTEPVEGEGEIQPGTAPGGDLLTCVHRGPYSTMGQVWQRVYARAAELGRTPGAGWEIYVDDPGEVAAADLRTELYLPLEPA